MTEAERLWTAQFGSKPEDTHGEKFKQFCLMLRLTKTKNVKKLEQHFSSGSFDRQEARELWKLVHRGKRNETRSLGNTGSRGHLPRPGDRTSRTRTI